MATAPDLSQPFDLGLDAGLQVVSFDLRHVRDHRFKKRGAGGRKNPGCAICRRGKLVMDHVGTPMSLNDNGAAANSFSYQTTKKHWQERLIALLEGAGVPRGLVHVAAEGQVCFPDSRDRDQGNYRFLLEKALGDALVAGGWLEDDDWSRYEFGALHYAYSKGDAWTALTIHATLSPNVGT